MSYTVVLSEEARTEEIESYHYYETLQPGLGNDFLNALENCYDALSEHPQLFSFIDHHKILRDVKIKRFPFVIIYEINDKAIFVFSVHHTSKLPFKKTD